MKVEKIQKLKSGKYKITLDDEVLVTYDDVILNNHLLYKKEIDDSDLETLKEENNYMTCYHKALNYVACHLRSKKKMEEYVKDFLLTSNEKKKIIKELEEKGFINDRLYAKAYASDSMYLKSSGPYKIEQELEDEGIKEEYIKEAIDSISQDDIYDKLAKLIDKRLKLDKKHSAYQVKQKIIYDMVNLGYAKDMIIDILDNYSIDDSNTLEVEYKKYYTKLSKKYKDKELYYKIQEKLYSKGFDYQKVNEFMQEKRSD